MLSPQAHPPPLIICFYLELSSPLYLLGHGGIWIPDSYDQPVNHRKAGIVSLSVTVVYVALTRIPWTFQAIINIRLNKECRNQFVKVLYSDSQFEEQREVKCDHAHPDYDYISLKTVPLIVTKYSNKDTLPNWLLWDQFINVSIWVLEEKVSKNPPDHYFYGCTWHMKYCSKRQTTDRSTGSCHIIFNNNISKTEKNDGKGEFVTTEINKAKPKFFHWHKIWQTYLWVFAGQSVKSREVFVINFSANRLAYEFLSPSLRLVGQALENNQTFSSHLLCAFGTFG